MPTCSYPENIYTYFPCAPKLTPDSKMGSCPNGLTGRTIVTDCKYKNPLAFDILTKGKRLRCQKNICSQASSCCTENKPPSGYKCDQNFTAANSNCSNQMKAYCKDAKLFSTSGPCNDFCILNTTGKEWCPDQKKTYCASLDNFDTDPYCRDYCLENDCGSAVIDYCQGANLETESCKELCFTTPSENKPSYDCGVHLKEYCADKNNWEKDICQCYLPAVVYEEQYADLQDKLPANAQVIIDNLVKQPYCSYSGCSGNQTYWPKNTVQCPDQNICFQNVSIDNQGNIKIGGGIDIQEECSIIVCGDQNPCKQGMDCIDGTCKVTSAEEEEEETTNGKAQSSWRIFLITMSVVIAVILMLIIVVLLW